MSKSANAEQLLAIEHQGGVLLRAGAGSGKTFVLVEHIVYLTSTWIADYKKHSQGSFEDFIRSKFSQVVMMTFTKKAAGEMSIRLVERFSEILEKAQDDKTYWIIVNDQLPMLMVTTIDGFCRKLITAGYFPHLSTEAKVIFNAERKDQVGELLDEWFEARSENISKDLLDIVIREKDSLLKAFTSIFNDPGLRLSWKKFSVSDSHPSQLRIMISQSFQLNDLSSAISLIERLDLPEESERSAFEKGIAELQALGLKEIETSDDLKKFHTFLSSKSWRPEATAAKKSELYQAAHEARKDLKDWVGKWSPEVEVYIEHYETKILPWVKLCQELFEWIDERLDPNQGLTFGDIEYLVALGLEGPDDLARIHKVFQYFIVDEFQDTSALQFQIIRSLIGSNFDRLFCVGDAKQAIYGFRGGELSVFEDCSKLVPQNRTLANNYRSLPEVIHFNNALFRTVLPLGQGFLGHDPFTVAPEDQNVPPAEEGKIPAVGSVEILQLSVQRDLETEGKLKNEHINRLEAYAIVQSIQEQLKLFPDQVCTALYSKLKPSLDLIRFLMDAKIGFTAQFKIDLLDDPMIGIFLTLLKRQFDGNKQTKDRFPEQLIKNYLRLLKIEKEVSAVHFDIFDQNVRYWGLLEAFRKFIHQLGVTNENADINLEEIETIAMIYHQDPEAVMVQIAKGANERISLELRSGELAYRVQIMSAHASKGLEFDTVYLGGIYTNGKEIPDTDLFGEMPGSFKWFLDLSTRVKRSSPFYLYENELSKYKNFSESKRLFYVACTRAKKKLVWVDLELPEKTFSIPQGSWIDGLNAWVNQGQPGVDSKSIIRKNLENDSIKKLLEGESRPQFPLFFHDPVGIYSKGSGESELLIAAELSVTRLNSLIDCPRKFYFENTLKFKGNKEEKITFQTTYDEEEELANVVRSSADRGTMIHAQIAKGIERNFVVPLESFHSEQKAPIEWALNELKVLASDFELIPEKPLKFKFFNFMISGIPDLLLMPKANQKAQIWDFKTGRITQENLAHYWVQLKVYAYALFQLKRLPLSSEIDLKLVFVDQKQTLQESISFEQCQTELYPLWRSQNEPWKINSDHCTQCPYGDICPR